MQVLEISTFDGREFFADEIFMVPQTLEILADVILEQIDLPRTEILWLGSPAWVISGAITDELIRRTQARIDARRLEDVRRLAKLSRENGTFILSDLVQNVPTGDWRHLLGYHHGKSIFEILPDKPRGFFGGSEGNFVGVSRSRERKTKRALAEIDYDYVVSDWEPFLSFRFSGDEFEVDKEEISRIAFVELAISDGRG